MPNEIIALIDKPFLLALVLGAGAMLGIFVEQFVSNQRRAKWRAHYQAKRGGGSRRPSASVATDAPDQLRTVMAADFQPQPLLNRSEGRLFAALEKIVEELQPDWRVMAQVSLGEILRSADPSAYACINSKRVDLLLVDGQCRPLHAIEYQGSGHHQGCAAARDAVKKEALRRAGIGFLEVHPGDTPTELKRLIAKIVGQQSASSPFGRKGGDSAPEVASNVPRLRSV